MSLVSAKLDSEAASDGAGDEGEQLERHDGYRVVEAMRPDLRPGESVTYVPDRYCEKCQQPRGIKRCSICGSDTVLRADLGTVQLPDLPPGAALDLGLETNATPPAAAPRAQRQLIDVTPPPDLDGFPDVPELAPVELAAAELAAELEPASELEPPKGGLLERAFSVRNAQLRAEEEARRRSKLLDAAARERMPAPAPSTNGTNGVHHTPSILDLRNSQRSTTTRLHAGRTTGRGLMEREQRSVRDDAGREVQRTIGRTGRARSAEEQLLDLWEGAKVDKAQWAKFAAAALAAGQPPEDAANSADALYMEMIRRENLATQRGR